MGYSFAWNEVLKYIPRFKDAILTALYIFSLSLIVMTMIGLALALLRQRKWKVLNFFLIVYSWVFRGIPDLIVLLFCFLALPVMGLSLSPVQAAVLGLSIVGTAYQFEVFKGGLNAVKEDQYEACRALGLPYWRMISRIILPQVLRVVFPAYITYATGTLKRTSITSAIAVTEIMAMTRRIMTTSFRPFEVLFVALVIYVTFGSMLMILEIIGRKRWSNVSLDKAQV